VSVDLCLISTHAVTKENRYGAPTGLSWIVLWYIPFHNPTVPAKKT
jgi:hypothetical protein